MKYILLVLGSIGGTLLFQRIRKEYLIDQEFRQAEARLKAAMQTLAAIGRSHEGTD